MTVDRSPARSELERRAGRGGEPAALRRVTLPPSSILSFPHALKAMPRNQMASKHYVRRYKKGPESPYFQAGDEWPLPVPDSRPCARVATCMAAGTEPPRT